jgi:hypothetical protein
MPAIDRYPPMVADDPLQTLVTALGRAQARAEAVIGEPAAGVRAVEPAAGRRWYLCAFAGPRFLCLDVTMQVERDVLRVHRAAACALVVEHAEGLIEQGEMDVLASASTTLMAYVEAADLGDALGGLARDAHELARWSAAPERAVASLPALEAAIALHEDARRHYERFMKRTEPLVEIQDRLSDELVGALRDVEQAAGRAGLLTPVPAAIAQAMQTLDAGAGEIVAAHAEALDGGRTRGTTGT